MSSAQRVLILTGLFLIAMTMAYGVLYAIFDEHQTLVGMGMLMAGSFVEAAQGNMDAAFASLEAMGALSQEYRYEVHSHGHWGMLSLVLIVVGLVFNRLGLSERNGQWLAWLLAASAFLFPFGVLLHIWQPTTAVGAVLTVPGSAGMILGLLIVAWCLAREPAD